MSKRIVVDPVTRIEGHLRIEVEVEKGIVVDAWAKGTMFRGIEQIVKGRDPRDAIHIVERICGVCMTSHGWTSAMAVENATNSNVPQAAQQIRNLLVGSLWLHDHILHFYHLSALDFLDVLAIRRYRGNDARILAIKDKIVKLVEARDTAPLTPRYAPDDYSVKKPEIVASIFDSYLKALHIQARAKKMSAILGGKQPHQSSIVAGGVTIYPSQEQLEEFRLLLDEIVAFVKDVYVPDVNYLTTEHLLPLARTDFGVGPGNYLAYGGFSLDGSPDNQLFKRGFISSNNPDLVESVDLEKITESVTSSWYKDAAPSTPFNSDTLVDLDKDNAYTFVKSPRYDGLSTEVGALSRMLVNEDKPFNDLLAKYAIKPGAIARHIARAHETVKIADAMYKILDDLESQMSVNRVQIHDTANWEPPEYGKGVGLSEAPRGALGHWIEIENQVIKNYQIVVPTTWNVSPRDDRGTLGPIEQALIGAPVDEKNPINLMRIIRSFNPCMACAVHVTSSRGEKMIQLR